MEPALHGRDDGSRKTRRLSSHDTRLRERYRAEHRLAFRCGLVKLQNRPLTCTRALPGARVSAGALARSDNDSTRYRQFVMVAKEEKPGGVSRRAEIDDHHAVL